MHEVHERSVLANHPKSTVRRAGEIHGDLNRRCKNRLQISLAGYRCGSFDKVAKPRWSELSQHHGRRLLGHEQGQSNPVKSADAVVFGGATKEEAGRLTPRRSRRRS